MLKVKDMLDKQKTLLMVAIMVERCNPTHTQELRAKKAMLVRAAMEYGKSVKVLFPEQQ